MTRKYFGTDGIRGRVGVAPITPDFALRLGFAAGRALAHGHAEANGDARPAVLIGKDTRISGYMLESALEAGLAASGCDVLLVGPMPTPGVAYLTRGLRLSAGIMISASHNPFDDNGIKFFSGDGSKLDDAVELSIEAELENPLLSLSSIALGKARRLDDANGRYIEFCKSTFPTTLNLRGLKLVLDCAHGAAYSIGPNVFRELGAEVIAIGNQPNGLNINEKCGATHPETMRAAVMEHSADMGLALDGDADRLMMCDADGTLFDGDQLLYAIVKDRHESGTLRGGVVGTLMTNFALEKRFAEMNVPFQRANVGDRYVLEMLREKNWDCGGENSGHLLCLDKHSTGDGIISALQVLAALCRTGKRLAEFTADLTLFPQVLVNIRLDRKFDFSADADISIAVAAAEKELDGQGRVLLRASGTEPLIRVMVEGRDSAQVSKLAQRIAATVTRAGAG
ncbi:MAG: phosphoglucosamine mutase [Burkholderiales bacterium]|nr:phosphoglucosamine mutase [Burkholderiales bacterium]